MIGNAERHGRPPIVVDVGETRVRVTDSGPGFSPEMLERATERFSSGDPARGGGIGLGLAIAAAQARVLGGRLVLANVPAGGAAVTIELPELPRVRCARGDLAGGGAGRRMRQPVRPARRKRRAHGRGGAGAGSSGGGHSTTPALPRRVTARIPLGGVPAIAWDGTTTMWAAVWAGGPHLLGSLIAVDTATGAAAPATVLPASNTPYLIAATASAVYVAGGGAVMRIDPSTGKVIERRDVGARLRALLAAQGRLWVTADGGRLVQLDPVTLRVVATRHVTGHPDAITTDAGSVLVTDDRDRTLTRMDIANGKVTGTTSIDANGAGRPSQITVYAGSIWVYEGTTVLRVATGALQLLDRSRCRAGAGRSRPAPAASGSAATSAWPASTPPPGRSTRRSPSVRRALRSRPRAMRCGWCSGRRARCCGWCPNAFAACSDG